MSSTMNRKGEMGWRFGRKTELLKKIKFEKLLYERGVMNSRINHGKGV